MDIINLKNMNSRYAYRRHKNKKYNVKHLSPIQEKDSILKKL